ATGTDASGIWASTWAGLAYVWRSRALRWFVVGTVVFVAFAAIDNVVLVFLVEDGLDGSATTYGLVQACFGVGMLVGSIGLGVQRRPPGARALVVAGAGATSAGSLLTAVAPDLVAAGGAQALAGVGNGAEIVATNTYVRHLVPTALLGRVFGAVGTSAQVGSSLAYLAGAPLVAEVGPRSAFTVAGLGTIIGLLFLLIGTRTRPANL
ncbi:MAG TPA: MFS transporter, partial [Friedmanniella sp.]